MPRSFSIAIQSEVAWRSDLRDLTVPATLIACPISSKRSVMVVLPASGWEMMAKVRRLATSFSMALDMSATEQLAGRDGGTLKRAAARQENWLRIVADQPGDDKGKSRRVGPAGFAHSYLKASQLAMAICAGSVLAWSRMMPPLNCCSSTSPSSRSRICKRSMAARSPLLSAA